VLPVSRSGYYAWAQRPPPRCEHGAAPHAAGADSGGLGGGRRAVWQPEDHGGPPAGGGSGGRQDRRAVNGPGGLRARVARRYKATTYSGHGLPVADNVLARQFMATQPHATWMADITYVPTDEGWLYLASLEDLATRPMVGGAADARMTQDLVLTALDRAVARQRPPAGVLPHADRGSQYAPTPTRPGWRVTA
jgi:putative transposase